MHTQIIEDLDKCNALLLQLKTEYTPMYRNLLLQLTQRREELKRELARN